MAVPEVTGLEVGRDGVLAEDRRDGVVIRIRAEERIEVEGVAAHVGGGRGRRVKACRRDAKGRRACSIAERTKVCRAGGCFPGAGMIQRLQAVDGRSGGRSWGSLSNAPGQQRDGGERQCGDAALTAKRFSRRDHGRAPDGVQRERCRNDRGGLMALVRGAGAGGGARSTRCCRVAGCLETSNSTAPK